MTAIADMASDRELLANYLTGDEQAFAELVHRQINLVYSAARRQVGDTNLADDVTQAVFMLLAKKAPQLDEKIILPAWLHRAARYCAANALRMAANRSRHERRAAEMRQEFAPSEPSVDWKEISPLLDGAINRLGQKDRQAIVLRFLEDKSHEAVAVDLGLSLVASRKRVERAVAKLRNMLAHLGAESTIPGLSGGLAVHAIQIAPVHLTRAAISAASAQAGSAGSMAIMKGATKMIFWAQLKTGATIAIAGLAITAGVALAIEKDGMAKATPAAATVTPQESLTARQTLIKIAVAVKTGDADYVSSHTSWATPGQKMVVDNQGRTCASVAKFRQAYGEAFGEAAEDQLPAMVGPTSVPEGTRVVENGDTATADFGVGAKIKMIRQNGIWKLDYSALAINALPISDEQLAAYLDRTLVAMDQVTLGLQLGKYKTADECLADLRTKAIQAAHEPTTKP
ncbi:MAG TPA: sigma-70 family RNA polymerase sigma factor [Tepidisphaeraceae bacterium]|jgi:RNA polymerase sigma factor (sigma-70 family)